ncbi:MAG TPA: GntP family permease [Cyclobacteriaceae bacterium]|jgi:GntP family gluconate:H+ symporter
MLTLLIVLFSLALILVAIMKFDIHPFLALFVGALIYGLLAGMPGALILKSISDGFGGVLGRIGLLILLGVMIGTFLERTGGAMVIAQRVLKFIGEKSVMLAMMITGFILSIPVFGDSAFIIMHPINKSLSFKGKLPFAATTIALTLGLSSSHSLVPPTPGPIATAGILGADLGLVILWGAVTGTLALIPSFFFVKYVVSRIELVPVFRGEENSSRTVKYPSLGKSILPIIIPILLIILGSIAAYPTKPFGDNVLTTVFLFIGNPVIALLFGVFLSFTLPEKFDRKLLSSTGWVGEAVVISAPIILITGAGGAFGSMLQNSGLGDLVSSNLAGAEWGIFLPFIMASALKTAQGSSTVAMITTASVMVPLMASLGLDSEIMKVFTVLSIGAGAIAISHANDSFFWVMTQMTGMSIKQGNKAHSLGTLILAVSAITIIYVLSGMMG